MLLRWNLKGNLPSRCFSFSRITAFILISSTWSLTHNWMYVCHTMCYLIWCQMSIRVWTNGQTDKESLLLLLDGQYSTLTFCKIIRCVYEIERQPFSRSNFIIWILFSNTRNMPHKLWRTRKKIQRLIYH